jgi:hypothetical protein
VLHGMVQSSSYNHLLQVACISCGVIGHRQR